MIEGSDELPTAEIDPKELVDTNLPDRKSNLAMKRAHDPSDEDTRRVKMVKRSPLHNDCSSSSWAEAYMSGSYQMNPPNNLMHQRFILQYLASLGEYQELLVHILEHRAIYYILQFIDGRKNQDIVVRSVLFIGSEL